MEMGERMNQDLFAACCSTVERRGPIITHRDFAEAVLTLYLNHGKVQTALTDEEMTERFEQARADGVEVVDHLRRRRVGKQWVVKETE